MGNDKKDEKKLNIEPNNVDPIFKKGKGEENSWTRFFFSLKSIWHSKKLRNKFLFLFLFGFFATIFGFFAGGFIYTKVVLGIVICIIFYIAFLFLTIFNAFEIMSRDHGDLDIFAFRFLILLLVVFIPAILSSIFLVVFHLVNPTSYFLVGNAVSLLLISILYLLVFIQTFLSTQITKLVYKIFKKRSRKLDD